MKRLRAVVLGLGLALIAIVAIASLRMPRGLPSIAGVPGVGVVRIGGGLLRPSDVHGDFVRLQKAAADIDREIEGLGHGGLVAGRSEPLRKRQHHRAVAFSKKFNGTIYVGIASYRNKQCSDAVASLFANAKDPTRVHVGVIEYRAGNEPGCIPPEYAKCQLKDACLSDNVRTRQLDPKHAKGEAYGHYASMHLYHGEEFILFTDDSQRFAPNWDATLIAERAKLAASVAKPVITYNPPTVSATSTFSFTDGSLPRLCRASFGSHGVLTATSVAQPAPSKGLLQPLASLRFLFCDAHLLKDVPLDPHLPYLEEGEEALFAARLWTHGWDMFSPTQNLAYSVTREPTEAVLFANDHNETLKTEASKAQQRVQYLLEAKKQGTAANIVEDGTTARHVITEADVYGMGDARPLDEYWAFAGVDPQKHLVNKDWCAAQS